MHSTALFSERFSTGDRGGNSIPVVQGGDLHSLWDGLLGRRHTANDVKRAIAELQNDEPLWKVSKDGAVEEWIAESHQLAKSFAYAPEILKAVSTSGELQRINLRRDPWERTSYARIRLVCIQAKRWEGTVGRPVVQGFVGSMDLHRSRKGGAITTGRFSHDARDYVNRIEGKKVVLIDGEQLLQLMIEHKVGVAVRRTYVLVDISQDFDEQS